MRGSFTRISTTAALAVSALFAKGGIDIYPPSRQPVPIQRNNYYAPLDEQGMKILPDPGAPMEEIMYKLETLDDYSRFMKRNVHYEYASFPGNFVETYRRSPEEFQSAGWKGCCNNTAEFACEWGTRQGYTMYLVSLWPEKIHQRAYEPWHQMAAICIENAKHYIIFDNTTVVHWNGDLDSYVLAFHPDLRILPTSGKTEWKATQDTFLGRIAGQIGPNVQQMKESALREPQFSGPVELAAVH